MPPGSAPNPAAATIPLANMHAYATANPQLRFRFAVTLALLITPLGAFARQWTNTDGVTIEAELVSVTESIVVLELPNGRRANYPLEKLSEPDRRFARAELVRLAAAQAEASARPATTAGRTLPEKRELATPELAKIPHPTDNSPAQLRRYIRSLLAYDPFALDQRRGDEVGIRERTLLLESLGASNIDLLLEQTGTSEDVFRNSSFYAIQTIRKLATDDHKELIFKAYARNYQHAQVIAGKNWSVEAEPITLQHLKKMPDWNGYSISEIEFTALCLKSERPEIWAEFQRFIQRGSPYLITGILNNLQHRKDIPEDKVLALYKERWSKIGKTATEQDLPIANIMLKEGDLDALKLIGKAMSLSGANDSNFLEFQLKRSRSLVVSLTDAPAGTNAEIGQWIRQNLATLRWDADQARFVKK